MMSKKLTTSNFIKIASKIHNNKYDYSLVEYINAITKVEIICPEHGIFKQTPNNHTSNKNGCPICKNEKRLLTNFIEKSKEIHNNKYDYSLVDYKNIRTKIKIICPNHGLFTQTPNNHLNLKQGCPKCVKHDKETFIKKSKEIHGDKYDYSLVEYKNTTTKEKIIYPIHGMFEQTYSSHIYHKSGCPKCLESKAEREISFFLKDISIKYISQKKFVGCRNKRQLPFDFYLPELNMCIEFDGEQHYRQHKVWGYEKFQQTQINDKIKTTYCLENNIKLVRIKYDENIENKLDFLKHL